MKNINTANANKNSKVFNKKPQNKKSLQAPKKSAKKSVKPSSDFELRVLFPWNGVVMAKINDHVCRSRKCSFEEGDEILVTPRPAIFGQNGMSHVPGFTVVNQVAAENGSIKFINRCILFAEEVSVMIGDDEIPGEVFLDSMFSPNCEAIFHDVEVAAN